jgi:uncharacterized protein YkwD
MKRLPIILILLLSLCGFGAGGRRGRSTASTYAAPDTASVADDPAPVYPAEQAMLAQLNVIRVRYGLVPFVLDSVIHASARRHCIWMVRARSMTHGGGYAENIAMGQRDVEAVLGAWMSSSGHRANILNPGHTRIGIAGYRAPDGTVFWCQRFSR